jgi:hypothetical protein
MSRQHFKKIGWFHRPITWAGYFALLFFLLFCVYIVVIFGSRADSREDVLLSVMPYLVPAFLLYEWFAWQNSIKSKK